jgi:aminoglycoside 3-N-acetyltransferase
MLLASHAVDHTPCGPHSPFHCLPQHHGKILMLGCGLRPNTSFHAIEELVEPPYLFGAPIDYTLVDGDGRRIVKRYITHNFAGVHQRYDRIGLLLQAPDLRVGRVLGATVHLLDAAAMWQAALSALQREALAFVEPAAPGAA